ncbi:MAG: uracil-DNA glycosylase [Hyphomicrobiaceae bacterium]|nr:uracil-DNA glycosylase [Hyphomicrobiaceae bacterium]MCC0009084.1 uracil-DNA glycosylase [Hyphomicrobiaceae bacterium]
MSDSSNSITTAQRDLVALLAWYHEAGVDCALEAEPIAWLEEAGRVPGAEFDWPRKSSAKTNAVSGRFDRPQTKEADTTPARAQEPGGRNTAYLERSKQSGAPPRSHAAPQRAGETARTPPARFATGATEASVSTARSLARSAQDIQALAQALASFEGCALKATAKSTCVYRGAESAPVMVIGEAPGRDEDLAGKPFVGRAGQLLDRMLAAIELDETKVHITNVVYWRPPGNRTPTPQETQICRPFLERQIELVKPQIVLLLGGAAAKTVLDTSEGIMRLRGKWRELTWGESKIRAMATLHPAYLLRTPAAKRMAWRDLLAIKTIVAKS